MSVAVRLCPACNRSDRYVGFADETGRNGRYGIAVAILCSCEVDSARKLVRSLVRRGQRRVHFSKQQNRDRKAFLSAISRTTVHGLFECVAGRPQTDSRSACWSLLVPKLIALGVRDLRIEAVDGAEGRDRKAIRDALAKEGSLERMSYRHVDPAAEPLVWIADSIAWSAGAGGDWLARVRQILVRM
jgi:hypothetical protein